MDRLYFRPTGEPDDEPETFAELIIRLGPFKAGRMVPDRIRNPRAEDYNQLREELIAAKERR